MRTLFVPALLLAIATPSLAADADGAFAVDGVGRLTCDTLLTAAEEEDETTLRAFASWTNGFISGMNALRPDTFDLTPWQTIDVTIAQMRSFCTANPEANYVNGLGQLIAVLEDDRATESSDLVSVRRNGQSVALYRSTLDRIRSDLRDMGYEITEGTGDYDETLLDAIAAYQKDQGLTESGLPDQETLIKLLL